MKIKFANAYVAKVSFNKNNPIHKAIAFCKNDNIPLFELHGSYESPILVDPKRDLQYFEIIDEVKSYNKDNILFDNPPEEQTIII